MTSMGTPASSKAWSTPRCARPREPPPLSTKPTALPAIQRATRAMSCKALPCLVTGALQHACQQLARSS